MRFVASRWKAGGSGRATLVCCAENSVPGLKPFLSSFFFFASGAGAGTAPIELRRELRTLSGFCALSLSYGRDTEHVRDSSNANG